MTHDDHVAAALANTATKVVVRSTLYRVLVAPKTFWLAWRTFRAFRTPAPFREALRMTRLATFLRRKPKGSL